MKSDKEYLLPLINRPDKEPDRQFIHTVRTTLKNQSFVNKKRRTFKVMPVMVTGIVLVLFSVISLSYYKDYQLKTTPSAEKPMEEKQVVSEEKVQNNEENLDVKELINNNEYYQRLTTQLSQEIDSTRGIEVLILYLESLRLQNIEEIKKYSFTQRSFQVEALVNIYKEIDYTTLNIKEITKGLSDPDYKILLNFTSNHENVDREIILFINDGENISVQEPEIY